MARIATANDLLLVELGRMLSAEEAILRSLSSLVERAEDPHLRRLLEDHRRETMHHVSNISEAHHELAGHEEGRPAPALDGLDEELSSLLALLVPDVPPELADLALISGARRVEAYEVASYESLVLLAEGLTAPPVRRALVANLEDERRAAAALAGSAVQLLRRTRAGVPGEA